MSVAKLAARLPDPETLLGWCKALALVELVLSPDWEYRRFSFDPDWGDRQQLASMRNGSGDEFSIVFTPAGAFIRGFDHESELSPWGQEPMAVVPGLVDDVPPSLVEHVHEPAFAADGVPQVTVCLWREAAAETWSYGLPVDPELRSADGGAEWLFAELDGRAETYVAFAADHHETAIDSRDVEDLLAASPITAAHILKLNPNADPAAVLPQAARLGHSVAPAPSRKQTAADERDEGVTQPGPAAAIRRLFRRS